MDVFVFPFPLLSDATCGNWLVGECAEMATDPDSVHRPKSCFQHKCYQSQLGFPAMSAPCMSNCRVKSRPGLVLPVRVKPQNPKRPVEWDCLSPLPTSDLSLSGIVSRAQSPTEGRPAVRFRFDAALRSQVVEPVRFMGSHGTNTRTYFREG